MAEVSEMILFDSAPNPISIVGLVMEKPVPVPQPPAVKERELTWEESNCDCFHMGVHNCPVHGGPGSSGAKMRSKMYFGRFW